MHAVYKWSTWKRFNDFSKLHEDMQKVYGYQIETIVFPPQHWLVMDKFSDDFINRRKDELAVYWTNIIMIPQATDFTKHHCSSALSEFLGVESVMAGGATEVSDFDEDRSAPLNQVPTAKRTSATGGALANNRANANRNAARRKSTKMPAAQTAFDSSGSTSITKSPTPKAATDSSSASASSPTVAAG